MYCVGLTGNAGSGKTTALTFFNALGIEVFSADTAAKILTQPGTPALQAIAAKLGQRFILADGTLNRPDLREHILKNPSDKQWLENLLHPLIRAQLESDFRHAKEPYCVIEIPLLYARSDYPYINRILLIKASHPDRIQRLTARDRITVEQADTLLSQQRSDRLRESIADDIILNQTTPDDLKASILQYHENLLDLIKS